jgi:hypothetical protein
LKQQISEAAACCVAHSARINEKNLTMNFTPDRNIRFAIFPVVTNFETMARRPGGLPRDKALLNARIRVQRLIGRGGGSAEKAPASRRAPWASSKWV